MHALGLYFAVADIQRDPRAVAVELRRGSFARVDAMPMAVPEPVSSIGRLIAIVRRRVTRMAGA